MRQCDFFTVILYTSIDQHAKVLACLEIFDRTRSDFLAIGEINQSRSAYTLRTIDLRN